MNIDKSMIIDFLKKQGKDGKAAEAEKELPSEVDTDKDQNLLERFGIDVGELVQMVSSGSLGDIGKKLGGFLK